MATSITLRGKSQGDFDTVADAMAFGIRLEDEHNKEIGALKEQIRALEKAAEDLPWWTDVADAINSFRVFPRVVIAGYMAFIYWSVMFVLEHPDPGYAVAGLVAVLTAALAPIMSSYVSTGNKAKD